MLCQTCCGAILAAEKVNAKPRQQHENLSVSGLHHQSWRDLETAVASGCYACSRLKWHIPVDIWTRWREALGECDYPLHWTIGGMLFPAGAFPAPSFTLQLKPNFENLGLESYGLSRGGGITLSLQGKRNVSAQQEVSQVRQASTSTMDALVQARLWFDSCKSSHKMCEQLHSTVVDYPNLLLDLAPENKGDSYWRLIDTTEEQIQGDYVTLSHRWSDGNITKLTAQTADDMRQGQPRSSLYQIYQDAMKIADHLGVRYLWIDSLCIFQDTRLDIRKAAQEMDRVYGNSVCNISALSGSSESIFHDRPDVLINPESLRIFEGACGLRFSYDIRDWEILSDALRYQVLSKRGWIYQEQVLAKRTLYFGRTQVLWNCPSGTACELLPDIIISSSAPVSEFSFTGLRQVNNATLAAARSRHLNPSSRTESPSISPSYLSKLWDLVISSYSGRNLTFVDDKLLAIAGITRLLADASQDTYLAGLWKSGLPRHLVWGVRDGSCRVAPKYRAPSWSWASINGPISFEPTTPRSVSVARVIDVRVQYDPINPFDSVSGGHLIIEAPCLEVPLSELNITWPQVLDPAASRANTTVFFDDIRDKRNPFVLGVALFIQIIIFRTGGRTFHGILLEPCSTESSPVDNGSNDGNVVKQYKRVGMFKRSLPATAPGPSSYTDMLRLVSNPSDDQDATFDFGKADMLKRFYVV